MTTLRRKVKPARKKVAPKHPLSTLTKEHREVLVAELNNYISNQAMGLFFTLTQPASLTYRTPVSQSTQKTFKYFKKSFIGDEQMGLEEAYFGKSNKIIFVFICEGLSNPAERVEIDENKAYELLDSFDDAFSSDLIRTLLEEAIKKQNVQKGAELSAQLEEELKKAEREAIQKEREREAMQREENERKKKFDKINEDEKMKHYGSW